MLRICVVGSSAPFIDAFKACNWEIVSNATAYDVRLVVHNTGADALHFEGDLRARCHVFVPVSIDAQACIAAIRRGFTTWLQSCAPWAPTNPLVSIYTPTCSRGAALYETFASVLAQTYGNWEWVIVDDASTEDTDMLRSMAETCPRVRVVTLSFRHGNVGAIKDMASRLCRGSILVQLDHDDLLLPHTLQRIVTAFEAHPDVDYVYGNLARFTNEGVSNAPVGIKTTVRKIGDREYHEIHRDSLAARLGPGTGCENLFGWRMPAVPLHPQAFRASAFFELGGYHPGLRFGEDHDLTLRFMLHKKWLHIDELLYLWRFGGNSRKFGDAVNAFYGLVCAQHLPALNARAPFLSAELEGQETFSDCALVIHDTDGGIDAPLIMESIWQQMPGVQRILVETNDVESQATALAHQRLHFEDAPTPHALLRVAGQRTSRRFIGFATQPFTAPMIDAATFVRDHGCFSGSTVTLQHTKHLISAPLGRNSISVIIPTYKRGALLARAVESALNQVYPDIFEILVIGDGCPELDPLTLPLDLKIRVFNLKKNHNDFGATPRNFGLIEARGNWIAYLDDDDTWEPNHLKSLHAAIKGAQLEWGFAEFKVGDRLIHNNGEQKGGLTTSGLMHAHRLGQLVDGWRGMHDAGYANDWDLVSRFRAAGFAGAPSREVTVNYNIETKHAFRK